MAKTTARQADILEVIADLSNDEVFTPPRVARDVLDLLPAAVWADPNLRWLDPGSKTGIFLREITRRLYAGLAPVIPDDAARLDHILRHQVFGVATSALTALMSRRTLYCAKTTHGTHSVLANAPAAGHVWHQRIEHAFNEAGRCTECGGSRDQLETAPDSENYAYPFIHAAGRAALAQEFDMQFDVIVGNPPYQMTGGGGGTNDTPLYNLFVESAIDLRPQYITMIVPSRWMAGGRGLDEFRKKMLAGGHIRTLVDHMKMDALFPGVDFEGGVCYFLWDREYAGDCTVTLQYDTGAQEPVVRALDQHDIFVRDARALQILERVRSRLEPSLAELISGDTPFGLATSFKGGDAADGPGMVKVYVSDKGRRSATYTERSGIQKNVHLIDAWKVLLPEAYGERGATPAMVLGPPMVAEPGSCCTQTFLAAGPLPSQDEAESFESYMRTRFVRFLVSLRKISQHALRSTYTWVPQQTWDREWTDEELYAKYGITDEEQAYIASMIREMT